MQGDGNLVLYGAGLVLWDSGTVHDAPDFATLQGDGNFVIYKGESTALELRHRSVEPWHIHSHRPKRWQRRPPLSR